jgi:oxygen-independent coproporphyrinogen-3 oxidase
MSEEKLRPIFSPAPDRSLSVYIHVPFCARKCRYCSFYSIPYDSGTAEVWSRTVLEELNLYALQPPIQTLYFGGGSPSVLPARQLRSFLCRLLKEIGTVEEFTVEINPAQADHDFFSVCRDSGVNRISIGAQSFHPDELSFLGRLHRPEDIESCVKTAKQFGFDNIGLDLIFGIPGSSLKSWEESLSKALSLDIAHLSAYSLTYEQGTPLFQDLQDGKIVPLDEETDRRMYEITIDTLAAAGFEHYEISNFARPGFSCRHNLRYWDNRPWIGLGPSAASWFSGRRTQNVADLNRYIQSIQNSRFAFEEVLTPSPMETACETAVLNLRKTAGINPKLFLQQTGYDPLVLFAGPIQNYVSLGLMVCTPESIRLTRPGFAVADSILSDFSDL